MSQVGNNRIIANTGEKFSRNSSHFQDSAIRPAQEPEGIRIDEIGILNYGIIGSIITYGGGYLLNNGINHCTEMVYPAESLTDTSIVTTTHCLSDNILGVGLMTVGLAIMGCAYWVRIKNEQSA